MVVRGEGGEEAERREHEIEPVGGRGAPEVVSERERDDAPLEQVRRDEVEDELRGECREQDRRVAPPRRPCPRKVEDECRADAVPARGDREAEPVGRHPAAEDVGKPARTIAAQTASGSIRTGRTNHMTTKIASVGIATKPGNSTSTRDVIGVGRDRAHEREERERTLGGERAALRGRRPRTPAASRAMRPARSRCCDSLSRWSSRTASSVVRAGLRRRSRSPTQDRHADPWCLSARARTLVRGTDVPRRSDCPSRSTGAR